MADIAEGPGQGHARLAGQGVQAEEDLAMDVSTASPVMLASRCISMFSECDETLWSTSECGTKQIPAFCISVVRSG